MVYLVCLDTVHEMPVGTKERMTTTGNATRFGSELHEVLRTHGISQTRLAERLGTTQSTVSLWVTGKAVPDPNTVFDIEEVLGLRPGQLSRVLGYLPVSSESAPADIEDCISRLDLDAESKRMLVVVTRTVITNYKKLMEVAKTDHQLKVDEPVRGVTHTADIRDAAATMAIWSRS